MASQFKQFRPNADLATDSSFRQAMLAVDRDEAVATANLRTQIREQELQQRRFDVSSALGIDEQTLQQLVNIAQLEIDQISTQLGVDFAVARDVKAQFGGLASLFASSALGLGSGVGGFNINVNTGGNP